MGTDAALARALSDLVAEQLGWLDAYPADQVDPKSLAAVRQSLEPLVDRTSLPAAAGLLVDLLWWLDVCDDEVVDPRVAVMLQGEIGLTFDAMPGDERARILAVLRELAEAETHPGRRYELRLFPYAVGLIEAEPDDEEPVPRVWVAPRDRHR